MECNQDLILRELSKRDEFVHLSSGHLVKRNHHAQGPSRQRGSWRGRGQGRGLGSRMGGDRNFGTRRVDNKGDNDVPIAEYMQ